jgi:hypothetical protein
MFTRVRVQPNEGGYLLEVDELQLQLIRRVVGLFLGTVVEPIYARLLIGADKGEALSIIDGFRPSGTGGRVDITLSLDQLHIIHAALVRACVRVRSEEDFYIKNGFFVENVRDLAFAMENAIVATVSKDAE